MDLRSKVEDDRGMLTKIQLGIPGFRGYRQKEDLRIADSRLAGKTCQTQLLNLLQIRISSSTARTSDFSRSATGIRRRRSMV